jgi:hypothetical protein
MKKRRKKMVDGNKIMRPYRVIMKQMCKQVVEIPAVDKEAAITAVMQGKGKVVMSDFQPSLHPDSWEAEEIK